MTLFFDTSALVKLFHDEVGSEAVLALLDRDGPTVVVSELARLEFVTAMHRMVRNREITDAQLVEALAAFDDAWATFRAEPMGHGIVREGEALIRAHGKSLGLRTLDALHLATFVLIADQTWSFVVADETLAKAARVIGCSVLNPLETSA